MATTQRPLLELDIEAVLELWPERRDTWVFVAVPAQSHDAVTALFDAGPRGFRSVRALARIDDDEWSTGLFLYRDGRWTLPIRADVRRRHHLAVGDVVRVHVSLPA